MAPDPPPSPRPRRIALVIGSLQGGGAERVAAVLARAWRGQGRDVTLVTLESPDAVPAYGLDPGLPVLRLDGLWPARHKLQALARELGSARRLRCALCGLRPDVVLGFLDQANVLALLACLGTGLPVVVSERVHPGHQPLGRAWRVLRRALYPRAAALVVQTPEIGRWCRRWNARVPVIPNPVLAAGPACADPGPVLLAAGRLVPQKGFDLLIRAFGLLAQKHPRWSLVIHGEGPLRPMLEEQARAAGLEGRISLPGWVPDLAERMPRARVFVLPSRYEGFPNVLGEAMAAGLACVAADCPGGGPAALIRQEEDGLLVPPGDAPALAGALDALLSDPLLRQRLGSRARDAAGRFSLERVLGLWDLCLARACAGGR